jgi:hypothetical protein
MLAPISKSESTRYAVVKVPELRFGWERTP